MGGLEGVLSGFQVAFSVEGVIFVFIGVLAGTFIGMLPGLGPMRLLWC
ncbi:hypothetical protein [Virgibacillus pantothenticus]|nr:hypothetical protein [Virgibacillus pantothenticus]MED3736807.1 hypothetical protein [Virgibacillus pantothenticus]QTY15184.1 hypothetical protein KBP50_14895 [Virgibacillus pantothenticus]SIT05182.1 putative tricarboxylic transport membrane protein [Virgibacillus pantothenticus]